MTFTDEQHVTQPVTHPRRPKWTWGGLIFLLLYLIALLVASRLIVRFDLPDSLLYIFTVVCVMAAVNYPRALYLAMIVVLAGAAWQVTRIVSPNPLASLITTLIGSLSTVVIAEMVRHAAQTQARLQHSRALLNLEDRLLAETGMALIECENEATVFDVIEDVFAKLALDAVVIVNQATPDQRSLVTRRIIGIRVPQLLKVKDLTGFEVIGKPSVIVDTYRELFFQNRLMSVPGGFPALAQSEIPMLVGKTLAAMFNLHSVYTIGIANSTTIYGNIHIITHDPDAVLPRRTIESLAYQSFMILSRMKAGLAQAESERRYRLLFENMNAGSALQEIIRDENGQPSDFRFLEMNAAFEEATGLKAADMIGRTLKETLPGMEPHWVARYGRVVDTGEPTRFESYSQVLDRIYEVVAYRPEAERFATVFNDVTERRRAETALREARDRLEERIAERTAELQAQVAQADAILSSVRDAIFLTDAEQRILYVNPAFTTLTGYASEEITGTDVKALASIMGSAESCASVLVTLSRHQVWQGNLVCRRKDGRQFESTLTAVPIEDADGTLTGCLFSQHDISQQQKLIRAREQFITNVSHQFRTPVTTLKLMNHLLSRADLPERAQQQVQAMSEQIEWLSRLLQDILELTALDSGKALTAWRPISLPDLVESVAQRYMELAQKTALTLDVAPVPVQLPTVLGDSIKLTQALDKLMSNAFRYTPPGRHVSLSITTNGPHSPGGDGAGTWVAITVRDTGPGIPLDEQNRLFERFFRGRIAEAGDTNGTGLGLSIAQQIAVAHGGKITFESEVGKGSTFTLWLPAEAAPEEGA